MDIAIFGWHFGEGGGALAGQLVSYGAALVCHGGGPLSEKREYNLSWVENLSVTTNSESSMSSIQGGRRAGSDSTSCIDSKREYEPKKHARDVKIKMEK
jgi:hypothetical protein